MRSAASPWFSGPSYESAKSRCSGVRRAHNPVMARGRALTGSGARKDLKDERNFRRICPVNFLANLPIATPALSNTLHACWGFWPRIHNPYIGFQFWNLPDRPLIRPYQDLERTELKHRGPLRGQSGLGSASKNRTSIASLVVTANASAASLSSIQTANRMSSGSRCLRTISCQSHNAPVARSGH